MQGVDRVVTPTHARHLCRRCQALSLSLPFAARTHQQLRTRSSSMRVSSSAPVLCARGLWFTASAHLTRGVTRFSKTSGVRRTPGSLTWLATGWPTSPYSQILASSEVPMLAAYGTSPSCLAKWSAHCCAWQGTIARCYRTRTLMASITQCPHRSAACPWRLAAAVGL